MDNTQLVLKDLRIRTNSKYVGFSPDGDSIKPIHIAGGVFRVIFGKTLNTKMIKQFAFVISKKGIIPTGSEEDAVKQLLEERNSFEEIPDDEELKTMRTMLQKLLGVDDGMYPDNSQLTFSAGSKYFIKGKAQYEDAGEFIGGVIKEYCPNLAEYIKSVLEDAQDPISTLLSPMHSDEIVNIINDADLRHKSIPAFVNKNHAMEWYLKGIEISGNCLKENLEKMPNALTRLRTFNFFCIYHLVRYMALLEAFYCDGKIWPFLQDFSDNVQSGIAAESTTSYARVHQSVSRFYTWAFAEQLKEDGITKADLLVSKVPTFDSKKTSKNVDELESQWELAKENAKPLAENKALLEFGKTIYNMSSMQASSYPVTFLRILGAQAGIVFPTQRDSKRKRFRLSLDTLEMVMRSCVASNETITYETLCTRLAERFNIVVSSLPINKANAIHTDGSLDIDVLDDNRRRFVQILETMDFADLMADGILRVHLGGAN